jgi:hypothetical protein
MKKIFFVFMLCLTCIMIYAQDVWTAGKSSTQKGTTITTLSNGDRLARVISVEALKAADVELIGNCLNTVWAIPGIAGKDASVRMEGSGFRLVINPTALVYRGDDLVSKLPGGLGFYYLSGLFYDVTLKVDSFSPKVTGTYVSPDDFLKQLSAAILRPEMYMYDDALLRRVERLEAALMAVIKKSSAGISVTPEFITAVLSISNEQPGIGAKEITALLKARGIKTNVKEVRAVLMVLVQTD